MEEVNKLYNIRNKRENFGERRYSCEVGRKGLILEQARRRASLAVKWRQVHWAMKDEKSKLQLG